MPQYATTKSLLEEQLKHGGSAEGAWPWRLLLFMIIVFVSFIFLYLGIIWGYEPYLDSQAKQLDSQISVLNKQALSDEPKSLINLYSQLANVYSLLQSHPMPSKILAFLESNTDIGIYYTNLDFSTPDRNLKMAGVSRDYASLGRQLELFRRQSGVGAVFLDDSKTRDSRDVQFLIRLIIRPELFR